MRTSGSDSFQQHQSQAGLNIDYKRVLFRAIRFWYVIVASLIIALFIAFINNRYSLKVYPVSASIIIRETEETGGAAEILYSNGLVDPYKNYLNELYIIRSRPLIESVIDDLGFSVTFQQEGNVLTSEIYGNSTILVSILNKDAISSFSSQFKILNERQYQIFPLADQYKEDDVKTFNFNEPARYGALNFIFRINENVDKSDLSKNPLIFSYTSPKNLAGSYAGRLSVTWAEKGAGVINLSITGNNPQKEMDFMMGLIKRYQAYDLEKKNLTASRTIDFINNQLKEISDSLNHVESILEKFKSNHAVTNLSEEASRLYEKLESVELQKTEMLIRANYNQYLIDYIKNETNLDQVILPSSLGLGDNILGGLISDMISVQLELKRTTGAGRLDNPLIQQKRSRLQEIKNNIVESIRNQQNTDKIKSDYINKQIRTLEKQLGNLPAAERQFISISRNYSLLDNLYVFLLQKKSEAGISKASSTSDVEMINPPIAGGAIYPKPFQNYLLAVLLGFAIPLALFFLMEYLNMRIQSKEDIDKMTTIPFIGGVGHKRSGNNLAVVESPKSMISESFRALRSNLSYFVKKEQSVVILISSSISGEGKTFVTINLSTVIAFSGKKTLIVGADLRRPKLFGDFNLPNDKGLSSYLAGMHTFDEVVQKTEVENLDLISGGPMPPNPSELMLRPEMEAFFKTARERYDYVIIDSPPLAIVSDAFLLNQYSDHLLFLVRQNYTQKDFLKAVDEFYRLGRLQNVSIVLNDIYKSGLGYGYGSGYAYGYGYSYAYGSRKRGHGYYDEQPVRGKSLWSRITGK